MIAVAEPTKCGCGSPKPSGGGCSCQAAARSDCACSQKRKPPGGATCCKAGGSCTCANGLRSPPPHSKADVDPIHVGMLGAPLTRRSDELEPPPVIVPRYSVIRCDPPHKELRPPKSFLDCRWYLLTSGGVGARPWVVEPPQSTELERDREEPFRGAPVDLDTYEERAPIPVVATSDEGAAPCSPGRTVTVARFSVAPACGATGHKTEAGTEPPLSPGQQAARGKGGGTVNNPCHCECACPERFPPVGGWLPGSSRPFDTVFDDRRAVPDGPIRIIGNEPPDPPFIDPTPPDLERSGSRRLTRIAGSGPIELPPIGPYPLGLRPPDGPAENVAAGVCEWCGQVRAEPDTRRPMRPRVPGGGPAVGGGVEPPQFAAGPEPVAVADLAALGTHSLGRTVSLAPPIHSDGTAFVSPAGVLANVVRPGREAL